MLFAWRGHLVYSSALPFLDQLAENLGDLFKFRGLIKKEIRPGAQTFLTIFSTRVVRANQNLKIRVVHTDRAEHVEATSPWHLQVENDGIRIHDVDAVYGF